MKRVVQSMMFLGLAALSTIQAAGPVVRGVRWESGRLAVDVTSGAEGFEITTEIDGVKLFLRGATFGGAAPAGVKAIATDSGLSIVVGRRGASVAGVSVAPDRIVVGITAGDLAESDSYRVGIGDVLAVNVYKNEDLTGEYTVSPEGMIKLPLVGSVPSAGSTEAELSKKLAEILGGEFLVDPQVSVTVKTYQSQFVYVTGSVASSRRVALRPGMGLKGILTDAGVALAPGQRVVLSHSGESSGASVTLKADDLDKPGSPQPVDGDVVTVQERDSFFIRGEIRRGGRMPLEPGMTLLQAISVAEGLTEWANHGDVRIRRTVDGKTVELKVNLKRVEDRRDPDPVLQPQDQILIKRRVF